MWLMRLRTFWYVLLIGLASESETANKIITAALWIAGGALLVGLGYYLGG